MDSNADVQKPQATGEASRHGFIGGLEDFVQSTVYSAIQKPIDGVEQVIDHVTGKHLPALHLIDAPKDKNWETMLGSVAGAAIDLGAIGLGVGAAFGAAGLAGETSALPLFVQDGIKGAAMGAVFAGTQPVDSSKNYWETKAKEVAIVGAGLATAGAAFAPLSAYMGESWLGMLTTRGSASAIGHITQATARDVLYLQQPNLLQIF